MYKLSWWATKFFGGLPNIKIQEPTWGVVQFLKFKPWEDKQKKLVKYKRYYYRCILYRNRVSSLYYEEIHSTHSTTNRAKYMKFWN
jgi:hypothetical protein